MGNHSQEEMPHILRLHGDYWSVADTGAVCLSGFQCTACGAGYLPAIATCSQCRGIDFRPLELSSEGCLYTYTVVRGSGGVWPDVYTIGYVDYPEEGVRVCGHIGETDAARLRIGMKMKVERAVLYTDRDGNDVECFRFQPSENDQ